jgi:Flp pilus assembly protein TadD/4-amino-4-deoxy-L-arabinose transferase-like glycosyltransferase
MHALIIFAVALTLRLIHVWQIRRSPFFDVLMGDANGYDLWAQRLAAGDWVGADVFYQAPLYPYFLGVVYAIFGRDLLIVRIVQAVIGAASCTLLGMAGARFLSRRIGLIAGLALALWAPAIFFDGLIQKSVLDMFFVCLGLYLLSAIRNQQSAIRNWIALGATMGALALTRENALVFIGVIAIWAAGSARGFDARSTRWFGTLVPFAAGLAIVLTPVVIRNYAIDGGFYLTTSQFGSNLYIGNNPGADGTYGSIRFGRGAPEFERVDAKEVAEASVGRALSPSEVSSYWTGRALGYITAQPLDWLQLTGRKILLLVNRTEMLDTESQESYARWSTPIAVLSWVTHFGVLVPLAGLGMILTWRDRRVRILHALTITYALSVVMFFVFARYRYPLVPFLMLFAAAPFDSQSPHFVRQLFAQGQRRRRWLIAATTVAIAVVANVPMLSPALMQAITENNLGTALQEQKRYDEAIRHHQRAIALVPDYAPPYNNLGAALRSSGRVDEAIAQYRKALELRPEYPSASRNLANALLAKGDTTAAMTALRAAIAIDDRSAVAHRNLGNLLIDSGARQEGVQHLERAIALAPGEPEAIYDIGTVLLEDQNFAAAASRFHAALKIRPDWPEAHNNLGIALASQGRIAEALTHFERAVQLKPDFRDARVNRDQARAVLRK